MGTMWPCFLLLPFRQGEKGISIYEERISRKNRATLQIGDWKDDEWPPEQIILLHHTPVYMFNCIIWLQSVVEIILMK
jgi:hypothetical protein